MNIENQAFLEQVRAVHRQLVQLMQQEHSRDLPLQDLIADRWSRAARLGWGKDSSVYENVVILGEVKVGGNTWVGPNAILDGSGGLRIGENCSISAGVQIYTHDSVARRVTDGKGNLEQAPTVIEDSCHVGAQSVIGPGVRVGHHSVIGAHSFLKTDVPPFSMAYGVPASVRGTIRLKGELFEVEHATTQNILEQRIASLEARVAALEND